MRPYNLLLIGLLIPAYLAGCASNPATGGADFVLMSESQEIAKGKKMHEELMAKGAAYDNKELQAYVQKVGNRLEENSHRANLDYTFTVINDENINAFALPGGYIYINRGLLAYLENEAQLAAVLGHEIGHVTARHSLRQQTAQAANKLFSTLAYIATRNADVANTTSTAGTALNRGYGREHELEADRFGAEYLYTTGYDTDAMIDVIGILKNHEQYNKIKAKASGRKTASYHGVFATHPRNDARLKTVVNAAKELGEMPSADTNPEEFRAHIEGIAWGRVANKPEREENRYYHNKLAFTFAYPEEWKVDATSKSITASDAEGDASVKISILRREKEVEPRDFLSKHMDAARLLQSAPLAQYRLQGHTGVTHPSAGDENRVAVLYYGGLAYLFETKASAKQDKAEYDQKFMDLIESFRPMKSGERGSTKEGPSITFIQAEPGTTFAKLAKRSRVGGDAEAQLRLINGYYPSGEPKPGEWIKVVK
ncbi:MAG: putative Zn-dependent protease [Halieaceae bacterium]|jgi:predicted Zn-dependent protease